MSKKRTETEEVVAILREWWSFNEYQQHTHSWHTREVFIEKELPKLLAQLRKDAERWRKFVKSHCDGGKLMLCTNNYAVIMNTRESADAAVDARRAILGEQVKDEVSRAE